MRSETGEKTYFLRKSGRITGPFTMLKLSAMFHNGDLKCEDMYSEDKKHWHYMDALFPALQPAQPIAVQKEEEPPMPPPVPAPEKTIISPSPAPAVTAVFTLPPQQELFLVETGTPAQIWLKDIARTFALLWNFQEIAEKYKEKCKRFFGISLTFHLLLTLLMVFLFGRYCSPNFHLVFSPLMGLSLLLLLWGCACLTGFLAAKYTVSKGQKAPSSWKICASGLFMNCGTLSCCALALAHGVQQHLWVLIFLGFIYSLTTCSSAAQLRDYLASEGKDGKKFIFCNILFLCPLFAAIIYCFIKLI